MKGFDADFPLCADEAADAAARPAVIEAVRFLHKEIGIFAFDAVILTGSFSRGEGSILLSNPRHRILGDIEFLMIARPPFDFPTLRRDMKQLGSKATDHLRGAGYEAIIEYSPAGRSYLERALRPAIFSFDLLTHGKTVAGDPRLLESIPRFGPAEIPREDAVRLVMNRMMEIHSLRVQRNMEPVEEAYLGVKTILDLAGSLLAFQGRYVSGYGARLRAAQALDDEASFPRALEGELARAVPMKLHPDEREILRSAPPLSDALDLAMDVWRWEMARLVTGEDTRELLYGFLASERIWQTARGWIKYYTHPLRPPEEMISLLRNLRLFFRASPQRLAYASALMAHHAERSGEAGESDEAARLLPSAGADQPLARAIELWTWLVRNN
ncbi:MAG: hypothetical protein ACRD21_23940 [Vicinamibacteria bacterium]